MNEFIQSIVNKGIFDSLPFKIVVLLISLLVLWGSFRRKQKKTNSQINQWASTDYQTNILESLPEDVRFDYSHLYDSIDEIYRMADRYQNALDIQKAEAAESIHRRIIESQKQIEQKWRSIRIKKDFYRYIGLHYASFTLADSIKKEQEILRDAFVKTKTEFDGLSSEIKALNEAIPHAHGERRYELMQQHKKLCTRHQQISQLKNIFGSRNTQYLDKVKEQNKITKDYREYIIHNCGKKGRAWGKRLKKRKLDQIANFS